MRPLCWCLRHSFNSSLPVHRSLRSHRAGTRLGELRRRWITLVPVYDERVGFIITGIHCNAFPWITEQYVAKLSLCDAICKRVVKYLKIDRDDYLDQSGAWDLCQLLRDWRPWTWLAYLASQRTYVSCIRSTLLGVSTEYMPLQIT